MAGLFFWRKKKAEEEPTLDEVVAVADSPEQIATEQPIEENLESTITANQDVVEIAEAAPEKKLEVKEPVELIRVELPKRSSKQGIRSLFSRTKFDPSNLDELEEILLQADFGLEAAEQIVAEVKLQAKTQGASSEKELRDILAEVIRSTLEHPERALNLSDGKLPYVFLVVGVNGAGKTTTIGKLSNWLKEGDWSVVLAGADTFRAAAVDQLATWAERSGAEIVKPKVEGQDPASVAFEAVELGISTEADIVIIDTAGRLQNKTDLMDELSKIRRVVEKRAAISEVLLVVDASTGQNALSQAKAFAEVANVTGIVLTKLDGTAKGGIVYSIQKQLGIPIKLVGVGEGINDFAFFDAGEFAKGLVA